MLWVLIFIFILLESVVTTLPLFLIGILIMLILQPGGCSGWVFVAAFFGGLVLDASAARNLGGMSLFLISWLFFILLYVRKYEINTIPFVIVSSFFGTFLYLWLFGYGDIFIQSIVGSFLSGVLFILFRGMNVSEKENLQFKSFRS